MSTLDDIQAALNAIRMVKNLRDRIQAAIPQDKNANENDKTSIEVTLYEAAIICAALDPIIEAIEK